MFKVDVRFASDELRGANSEDISRIMAEWCAFRTWDEVLAVLVAARILLAAFFLLTLGSGIGIAAEIYVQPGDSIQTAVDNAVSGDVILLKPGTYTENVKAANKMINLLNLIPRYIQSKGFTLIS